MWKGAPQAQKEPADIDSGWSPAQGGGFPSYHGTDGQHIHPLFANALAFRGKDRFKALTPQENLNQVAPQNFGYIYTGFSALRCYLQAFFKAGIYLNSPEASDMGSSQKSWLCNGASHKGLVWISFSTMQTGLSRLRWSEMLKGVAKDWAEKTRSRNGLKDDELAVVWKDYKSFHGESSLEWPDMLHCREFGPQADELKPFRTNVWRTVWAGKKAVDAFNSSHKQTYSISFTKTQAKPKSAPVSEAMGPPPQQPPPRKDDGEDKGKVKGKDIIRRLMGKAKRAPLI